MERNARSPQELFCIGVCYPRVLPQTSPGKGPYRWPSRALPLGWGLPQADRWGRDEVGRPLQSVAFRMAPAG